MAHERKHYCFIFFFLFLLSIVFAPLSRADNDTQILLRFKNSLSDAGALQNWDESINICSWTGLLCKDDKLHGLKLENMGLSGTIDIDILSELSILNSFSVINNNFEGPMPEFKKLERLRGLFLSNNKFSGQIHDDAFVGMRRLKRVFLAENEFSGHIPSSLAQLPRLLDVDLHGNRFDGTIPEFENSDFRVFDLSNNQLEGSIPKSLSNVDPSAFAGNKGLCGKPLSNPCSNNEQPTPQNDNKTNKHRTLIIIIIIVVIVVILVLILALFIIIKRRRKAKNPNQLMATSMEARASIEPSISIETKSIDSVEDGGGGHGGGGGGGEDFNFVREDREVFDLQYLLRASAEVLGSGSFGSTYKAMIHSGQVVVVKRFKNMNKLGKQEFFEHMRRLGRLTHPNVLPLVAFYYGKEEKLLVYDFVQNGSLASHLHGKRSLALDWPTRLKIIKGVARGLAYLYKEFPDQKLPHGHLKSSNVLLDHAYKPLLTEYQLVPAINKSHAQQFMAAFKSPEASQHDSPGDKTDVWCLGILILELLTGRFPADYVRHGKGASEELETWVKSIVSGEVIDKDMVGGSNGQGEMLKMLRVGMGCCEWNEGSRLEWKEALAMIEEVKEKDNMEDESSGFSEWDLSFYSETL
ncbi:pollen receptor-like kinase 4 [Arachis duranensis]|uniref:Pollen receptor-like kinase 4 n=1 Tax=Arachis duranensis TaxID=130453 RepID=A0A9C6WE10_ARADU|nr:pollen receptor-like kinase 4 [Arachis duranensis]